ncbi:MAG: hypothetical protein ACI33L_05815 [Limosilactobacillus sp.]|uniref:hypothetical protein n=1 Tax=Limosilactobacillus sp. TaxID=2773925 RepID=UPI003EFC3CD7
MDKKLSHRIYHSSLIGLLSTSVLLSLSTGSVTASANVNQPGSVSTALTDQAHSDDQLITKDVVQIINYVNPLTKEKHVIRQVASFQLEQNGKLVKTIHPGWQSYVLPYLEGYTPNWAVVPPKATTPNSADEVEDITYRKNQRAPKEAYNIRIEFYAIDGQPMADKVNVIRNDKPVLTFPLPSPPEGWEYVDEEQLPKILHTVPDAGISYKFLVQKIQTPSHQENRVENKQLCRTITLHLPTGDQVITQHALATRNISVEGDKMHYGEWQISPFDEFQLPKIDGYQASLDKVAAQQLTADQLAQDPITVEVDYHKVVDDKGTGTGTTDDSTVTDPTPSGDKDSQTDDPTMSDGGTQTDQSTSTGTQTERPATDDGGTQTEPVTTKDDSTQTDQPAVNDKGTQTESATTKDDGTQTDQATMVDEGSQTATNETVDTGVGDDSIDDVDQGTQTESPTVKDDVSQTENKQQDDSTQTEVSTGKDAATQTDQPAVTDKDSQTSGSSTTDTGVGDDSIGDVDQGTQTESPTVKDDGGQTENKEQNDSTQTEVSTGKDAETQTDQPSAADKDSQTSDSSTTDTGVGDDSINDDVDQETKTESPTVKGDASQTENKQQDDSTQTETTTGKDEKTQTESEQQSTGTQTENSTEPSTSRDEDSQTDIIEKDAVIQEDHQITTTDDTGSNKGQINNATQSKSSTVNTNDPNWQGVTPSWPISNTKAGSQIDTAEASPTLDPLAFHNELNQLQQPLKELATRPQTHESSSLPQTGNHEDPKVSILGTLTMLMGAFLTALHLRKRH